QVMVQRPEHFAHRQLRMAGLWHCAGVSTAKRPDRRGWLSSARHPARRDGIMALAFVLLPWLLALGLERRERHLDGGDPSDLGVGVTRAAGAVADLGAGPGLARGRRRW